MIVFCFRELSLFIWDCCIAAVIFIVIPNSLLVFLSKIIFWFCFKIQLFIFMNLLLLSVCVALNCFHMFLLYAAENRFISLIGQFLLFFLPAPCWVVKFHQKVRNKFNLIIFPSFLVRPFYYFTSPAFPSIFWFTFPMIKFEADLKLKPLFPDY